MDHAQVLKTLNWFLLVEKQQTELYESQSKSTEDYNLSKVLNRFKEIEQEHINSITKMIKELGGHPSTPYEYTGIILGEATKQIGTIGASYTDITKFLQLNIMGEQLAIRDYKKFINSVDDPKIEKLLWRNMIDEELHMKWMQGRVKELKQKKVSKNMMGKRKKDLANNFSART